MKNLKLFSFLFLLMITSSATFAQNGNGNGNNNDPHGNAVVSEVKVHDNGNGSGTIEVRVSGNLAEYVSEGTIMISGDRVRGVATLGTNQARGGTGLAISPASGNGNGSSVIVSGIFPLLPSAGGNGPDFVDVNIELRGRFGNNTITVDCPKFEIKTYISY